MEANKKTGDMGYSKNDVIASTEIKESLDKCMDEITRIKSKCICFQASNFQKETHSSTANPPTATNPYYLKPY